MTDAEKTIVIVGDPIDGFAVHGPFDDMDEANAWAERALDSRMHGWWFGVLEPVRGAPRKRDPRDHTKGLAELFSEIAEMGVCAGDFNCFSTTSMQQLRDLLYRLQDSANGET